MKLLTIALLSGSALFAQAPEAERSTFPPALEKFLGLAPGPGPRASRRDC